MKQYKSLLLVKSEKTEYLYLQNILLLSSTFFRNNLFTLCHLIYTDTFYMKRKWIRWVSWILLTPIILFVILMVLLYVPPVQNLLRREVTAYASKVTGMQIQVERIDLRFPLNLLVRGVEVIQQPDTLLSLESLNVRVQAWPLIKGKVERRFGTFLPAKSWRRSV